MGTFVGVCDGASIVVERLVDAGVLVRRNDERVAFLLEDRLSPLDGRIYESDNLQTGSELAVVGTKL